MTIVWFIIWFVSNRIGDHEVLTFSPVNTWAWTLILAVALDLASTHARAASKR